jgi:hypothetical protein
VTIFSLAQAPHNTVVNAHIKARFWRRIGDLLHDVFYTYFGFPGGEPDLHNLLLGGSHGLRHLIQLGKMRLGGSFSRTLHLSVELED